ncbi:MAG: hypothetical protein HYW90_02575 [Candidatus Sungbacteria bacterium]|nr:hypothetical protein [Candidatus Sungbacteria bacterium]
MNAAEEIVKYWLQSKGYFIQSSISLPKRKEIDILAIHKNGAAMHVEVSVSIRSVNSKNAKLLAKEECNKKFKSVTKEVEARFGKKFKRVYIRGRIAQNGRDIRDDYAKECKKIGVEVLKFENVLKEAMSGLATPSQFNPIIKTLQLMNEFSRSRIK